MLTQPTLLEDSKLFRLQDYDKIRRAIEYLNDQWREQPDLNDIASHVGLTGPHFQRLFKHWSGLSPKEFLQAITIDHARQLLKESASILDTSMELGLSGPSRLHDLFIDHEAMTPGEFKLGGEGIIISFGYHESPFGLALLMITDRGLCGLAFADNEDGKHHIFGDMQKRWPNAEFKPDRDRTAPFAEQIFDPGARTLRQPLRIVLIGTDFERKVWEALLKIPVGHAVSYSDIAGHIDVPRAVRAVGSAVGRNPISFVVPCHRVLRKDGNLGGYHWGITRKKAIIGWEKGHIART